MLLMDYWPLRRISRRSVSEKIPLLILAAIFAVIFFVSQERTAGTSLPGQYEHSLRNVPLIICHNIIFYPAKMLWPVNLSSHYAYPEPFDFSNPALLASVIATIVLIILLVFSLRRTPSAMTGWLIFFVAIMPTMQVLKFSEVIASDKYAYLPAIGLLMILAYFIVWLHKGNARRIVIITLMFLMLAACEAAASRRYLVYWKDTVTLYKHMLKLAPNAAPLYGNLGNAYGRLARYDEALEALNTAVKLRPNESAAHYNLGVTYLELGRYEQAIETFKKAVELNTGYAEAWCNLGYAYGASRRFEDEIDACDKAIEFKPDYLDAYINLGFAYGNLGQFSKAADAYAKAVEIAPKDTKARSGLAIALFKKGDHNYAIEQYQILKQLDPNSAARLNKIINP